MGESRCIRWASESNTLNAHAERFVDGDPDITPRAYCRRLSANDASPMDACRLRKLEYYPSSQMFASSESLEKEFSSESCSTSENGELADQIQYDPHLLPPRFSEPEVLPATSHDFAELFPSSRNMIIQHDDTTLDGNMNLRVDTPITTARGIHRDITLFHLRMYDLKSRDLSLRRYCRDSGREVCHCSRKSSKQMLGARPNIQRSLSNAFAAMLPKNDSRQQQSILKRQDSGYDTSHDDYEAEMERPQSSSSNKAPTRDAIDNIKIEYSNYAHLDLRRRGFKADKRYDFDYWGCSYSWHRSTQKMGQSREVSYHLTRRDGSLVARIIPQTLSEDEASGEAEKGGWVPPCSLRILDEKINGERLADVAEVVVSTGLIVLVDDCIRARFRHQEAKQRTFRLPNIKSLTATINQTESTEQADGLSNDLPHRKLLAEPY